MHRVFELTILGCSQAIDQPELLSETKNNIFLLLTTLV
jgi:hypothetical protein